jgi:hypothetical protein
MTNRVGLWIDHQKAVIVSVSDKGETVNKIESGAKRIEWRARGRRYSADGAQYAQGEDQLDNQFNEQLKKYYDRVAVALRGATEIFIFGPGEARTELKRHLLRAKGPSRHISVQPADKLTEPQIVARARQYFEETGKRS